MSPPLVTVLLPTLNSEDTIQRSVRSVLEQTHENIELLVLDSNSTDDTAVVAEGFDDDRVVVLDCGDRTIPEALNYGARCAGGTYLARQDSDDWSDPERFERQVAYLEDHTGVGIVGTYATFVDGSGRETDWKSITHPTLADLQEQMLFVGGSLMIRSSSFAEIEGYDERFRISEDYDFILRMAQQMAVHNIPESLYEYTVSDDGAYAGSLTEAKLYHMVARRRSLNNDLPDRLFETIEQEGVDVFYDHLNQLERAYFHTGLAQESLRFGRLSDGRYHARQALKNDISTYALSLLVVGYFGRTVVDLCAAQYRRYINWKRR